MRAAVRWLVLALGAPLAAQAAAAPPGAVPPIQPPAFRWLAAPPTGLGAPRPPAGYQPTAALFALGERLFADPILSGDRTVSCATCHPAASGFASPLPQPLGVRGQRAARHAPSLWNRGYGTRQRWDGRSDSLEAFVLEPIADPREMDLPLPAALQRLQDDAGYRAAFQAATGRAPDQAGLQQALATFVRGIVRGDAAYDRFVRGEVAALSRDQRAGLWLFESKAGCWRCHPPPLFTDERFHNTGGGLRDGRAEAGRAAVSGDPADTGKWKTPTLRGIGWTAPYLHDGSLGTLEQVVDFYAAGGGANPHRSPLLQPLDLSPAERAHLVAFLRTL